MPSVVSLRRLFLSSSFRSPTFSSSRSLGLPAQRRGISSVAGKDDWLVDATGISKSPEEMGIVVYPDFVSPEEEQRLMSEIEPLFKVFLVSCHSKGKF